MLDVLGLRRQAAISIRNVVRIQTRRMRNTFPDQGREVEDTKSETQAARLFVAKGHGVNYQHDGNRNERPVLRSDPQFREDDNGD